MANIYSERLDALRGLMQQEGLDAVIVPQADPHMSEYLAAHWKLRGWLSGFTGSAGDLVVTATAAALWTDSRYFLQAAVQLDGSGVELMKAGLAETPSMAAWLCGGLHKGARVGVDPMLMSIPAFSGLSEQLAAQSIMLVSADVSSLWENRPALPDDKIYIHSPQYAGESASSKIERVLDAVETQGADAYFISALDEIAWTLNIRSNDVRHTPVATAYLFLAAGGNVLFVEPSKTTPELCDYLTGEGVEVRPYIDTIRFLESLPQSARVLIDPAHTTYGVSEVLGGRAVDCAVSPVAKFKSVKNDVQIAGIRAAMVRDGVAMVRSFMEIERRLADGVPTTELDVVDIFHKNRARGENYTDESFGSIVGYGPHGAIVHYEPTPESNVQLRREGLLLIDSGGQYLDGTTDITRTISLGTPTALERHDFTTVMKGHIALAMAVFPEGTCGTQLDALAHAQLWKERLNYLHGTGHGVGHFLGVHEGPHQIRMNYMPAPILAGSVTSNEPGLYRTGQHGIRCENLVLCRTAGTNEFGSFLQFETLTLCPFDLKLFDLSMMNSEEIEWVDTYHTRVRELLEPALEGDERAWLAEHTKKLQEI